MVADLRRRPDPAARLEHLLWLAAFLFLLPHALPLLRSEPDRPAMAAAAIGEALEQRLEEDVRLLRAVTSAVDPGLSESDPQGAFERLAAFFERGAPQGRAVQLFGPSGGLVAWYGPSEDLSRGPTTLRLQLPEARAPRAAAAPLSLEPNADLVLAGGGNSAGVVLRSSSDGWVVALEDLWLRSSPVEALGLPRSGVLAELERRWGVRTSFSTVAGGMVPGRAGAALSLGGHTVARVEARPASFALEGRGAWLRLATFFFLAALVLFTRWVWLAISARAPEAEARHWGALAGFALRAFLVLALRLLIEGGRFLEILLPGPVSSPLSFASGLLGPFTSSPADLVVTGLLSALVALDAFSTARRWSRSSPRHEASRRSDAGPPAEPLRSGPSPRRVQWDWVRGDTGLVGILAGSAVLGLLLQRPLLEVGALVIRDTSTHLLLRPHLYSSPEGALLFAGLVAFAATFVLVAGTLFLLAAGRLRRSGKLPLTERLWPWALALAILLALGAALHLERAGPDFSSSSLALALWSAGIAAGFALAGLATARELEDRPWVRRVLAPALVLGLLAALGVTTAYGAGRVWGLRRFLADRLEQVALPSNQWLEYNLELTGQRLAGTGSALRSLGEEGWAGAAFLRWAETPLRELPFPSALVIADGEGSVLSRFSLLPPEDLGLLARIARAALRARPGRIGRAQTPAGRSLFFTAVPLAAPPAAVVHAVAVASEALEPSAGDESDAYFLRDVFSADPSASLFLTVRRGDPVPRGERSLTLASGEGEDRLWISLPLAPYLPDALDYLSLCLTALAAAMAFLALFEAALGKTPLPWPRGWVNPLATFRGRIFSVLLALVAIPVAVYSWISFQTTRHEIELATRALAEESLRAAAAFLGPRLEAGGEAELEAILPEAARVVGQDLILYRGGEVVGSNRPEIFQANLFSRRMPGDLYQLLAFGGERLATELAQLGERDVIVAYLKTPWSEGGVPYILASPLLVREDHISHDQRDLFQVLFVMFALSLLALGIFSWLVSRQLSSPLGALKEGADRIARGELAYRLRDPERSDEFGLLFSAFNTMAAGLQVSQGELLAEKGRIQAILSSLGAGVIALDRDGRVTLANQGARELLGLSEGIVGHRVGELSPPQFWERVGRALKLAQRREDEVRLTGANGARTLHLAFAPLRGEGGERRGLVVVFEDISGVVASQRTQAWEEMARQVAHEIKNPLTPIKLSLQHLQRLLSEPPEEFPAVLERSLDLVLAEIGRLERIAGEFSRFGVDRWTAAPMELEPTVREIVELYAQQGDRPRLELEVVGRPVPVLADRDGLKKVLVNLLQNAREAMSKSPAGRGTTGKGGASARGGVASRKDAAERDAVTVQVNYDAADGQVLLRVRDRGPGIPPEDLERLFQPYFSTKTRGTGLGLAIARRIVESWGGRIEARNWQEGAEVLLWLGKSPASA